MKDYKFRHWNLKDKHWDNPALLEVWNNEGILCSLYGERGTDYVIQQYMGITDKNSKELYEGDIVRFRYKMDEHGDTFEESGEVYYDEKMCALSIRNSSMDWFVNEVYNLQLIGNIFENPELQQKK